MRYVLLTYLLISSLLTSYAQEISQVDSLNILSHDYYHLPSKEGIRIANEAIELSQKINYKKGEALAYNLLGAHLSLDGQYDKAFAQQIKALEIYNEIADNKGIGQTYDYIGTIYKSLNQLENALDSYQSAIDFNNKSNNTLGLAIAQGNIAIVFRMQNKPKKALDFLLLSLKTFESKNDEYNIARTLNNIGNSYYDCEDYAKASSYFKRSYNIFLKLDYKYGIAASLNSLGKTHLKLGQLEMAEKCQNESLRLSSYFNDKYLLKKIYFNLFELYNAENDSKKALDYHIKYSIIQDSIISESRLKNISFAETKYKTELSMKEIAVLKANNELKETEIRKQQLLLIFLILFSIVFVILMLLIYSRFRLRKRAEKLLIDRNEKIKIQRSKLKETVKKLNKTNREKDKMMSIISHDLRNPFNVILGLLELLEDTYEELSDNERISYIKNISKASNTTYNLLEDLLTWSRAQLDGIIIKRRILNVKDLCEKNIQNLMPSASYKNINLYSNINASHLINVDEFTVSTVISNIVSNAIKFTPNKGEICVSTSIRKYCVDISIADNGLGMAQDKIDSLFNLNSNTSSEGTNKEKGTGLGLLICNEFVKLNKGSIRVESEVGKGSTFIISLPVANSESFNNKYQE